MGGYRKVSRPGLGRQLESQLRILYVELVALGLCETGTLQLACSEQNMKVMESHSHD